MTRKQMLQDTRGISVGIMGFIAVLVIGALLYTMLNGAATSIFDMSLSQASSQQATDAINQRQEIWGGVLFFVLLLGSLSFLAQAVRESGGPR